jgi:hypothetical protein
VVVAVDLSGLAVAVRVVAARRLVGSRR